MTEGKKFCPFVNDVPSECIGEGCACYIKVVKPIILSKKYGLIDENRYYAYKGCGLVRVIPWQIINRDEIKKTPEMKQAEAIYAKLENIEK